MQEPSDSLRPVSIFLRNRQQAHTRHRLIPTWDQERSVQHLDLSSWNRVVGSCLTSQSRLGGIRLGA